MRRAVAFALALAGCSSTPPRSIITCSPPECTYTTSLTLVAEVDPGPLGPYVRQELTAVDISARTGDFQLKLDKPATLSGMVTVTSLGVQKPLAASLQATRPSRISGRPDVYYQANSDPKTGGYQLVVSPTLDTEQYAVRVTPNDPTQLPPMLLSATVTADQTLSFEYPDPLTLPEMHGVVSDSLQNPVAGMQVQAIDPQSGLVVSTTATTDHTGSFELRLAPSPPQMVKLVATPTAAMAGTTPSVEPTLTRMVTLPATPPPNTVATIEADLKVPPLPAPAHTIYAVAGVGPSGAPMPVVGATCVFSANLSDPTSTDGTSAFYSALAVTDASGNAVVDLVPALNANRPYQVNVTPDASSPFQAVSTTVIVAPQGGYAQALMLPLRPTLSGSVLDPTGRPLADATISPAPATLAAAAGVSGTDARMLVPTTAPTEMVSSDGRFALRLDPAVWDVGLSPPAGSMLPRLWLTGISVTVDTPLDPVKIPKGVMVHGVVRSADGAPLPGADVRLYTVAAGNANCAMNDLTCLAPPLLRAEGPTDATGTVPMILPTQPM